jgi:hypothetical protein
MPYNLQAVDVFKVVSGSADTKIRIWDKVIVSKTANN